MSANPSSDVTLIQDEDVLRKMWQDTQDFGRKKEIRTHMYKLREARLRDFYNTEESNTDIQRTSSESKSCNKSTHADALVDHSFLSLKSKEIRDSESPTRDMNYKMVKHNDNGWNVVTTSERSEDGKMQTTKRSATTSGSQNFQGGKVDYAARNDQKSSVYQDGDDKNFVKAVGAESRSVIKQEAVGGDDNNTFKTSSTKTSTSSRTVTESKSTSGDIIDDITPVTSSNQSTSVTKQIYGNNIPDEIRNHPNYVDGKTKVFRETKTLSDGSTVTTTRYETIGGSTSHQSSKQQHSTASNQRRTDQDSSSLRQSSNTLITKQSFDEPNQRGRHTPITDENSRVYKETKILPDGSTVTTTKYETIGGSTSHQSTKQHHTTTSNQRRNDQESSSLKQSSNTTLTQQTFDEPNQRGKNIPITGSEENTRVYKETKTLPDGSTVTTTKYETIGGSTSHQSTKQHHTTTSNQRRTDQESSSLKQSNTTLTHQTFDEPNHRGRNIPITGSDENTRVYKETKTLPDGSTVTTTKYETTEAVSSQNTSKQQHVNTTNQKSDQHFSKITKQTYDDNRQPKVNEPITYTDGNTRVYKETKTLPDGSTITTTRYETTDNNSTQKSKNENYSTTNKHHITQSYTTNKNNRFNKEIEHVKDDNIPSTDITVTITRDNTDQSVNRKVQPVKQTERTVKTTTVYHENEPIIDENYQKTTTVTNRRTDNKQQITDEFINIEQRHEKDTRQPTTKREPCSDKPVQNQVPRREKSPDKPYDRPERRQPIKPGKSELESKPEPTEGQYDTTYRSEFTPKRISVDVSPTHDAFARSLRAVSPDRISHRGSVKSLRTSTSSLRSSTSPEKNRHPSRYSPERKPHERSISPRKSVDRFSSSETITYRSNRTSPLKSPERTYSTDTITKKSTPGNGYPTLPRTKNRPRSRSPSPSTTASDIEFIRNTNERITDLDDETFTRTVSLKNIKNTVTSKDVRPTSLEITTKKTKKITERSPTSPITEFGSPKRSPVKELQRRSSLKSPLKEPTSPKYGSPKKQLPSDKPLKRTDTYEERCRQILGIKETTQERRRSSLEKVALRRDSLTKTKSVTQDTKRISKSPEKYPKSPNKESPERKITKVTTETVIRKSPGKENRSSPTKITTKREPSQPRSQTRESPEKQRPSKVCEPYPEKRPPSTTGPSISEFPSQIRKSPTKEPLGSYPEKQNREKTSPSVSEFPSQIRKTPEREPREPYPEKHKSIKTPSSTTEFPSQIRRSPEREPLEPYPEKRTPVNSGPSVCEFPSQIRRSPEREPLEPYPEKRKPSKTPSSISEFPSQITRSPEREPLEPYPEKPDKTIPYTSQFPSQIRKTPEREPLEPYPKKQNPIKMPSTVSEFPSQTKKSPEREPLEPYPEKQQPKKIGPTVSEFPSQIRRSPEREVLEPYPEKRKPTKSTSTVSEFPSQTTRSPEKEPLEPYPEKQKPKKTGPSVCEFPSQIRKTPERETLEPYPEKRKPTKTSPTISEFPSQVTRSPEREPFEPYSEKPKPKKTGPSVSEFPSQIRKTPERETPEPYPEKRRPTKTPSTISEFPSQTRRSPEREPIEPYPEKEKPKKTGPSVTEFPSQVRKIPEREILEPYPEKRKSTETTYSNIELISELTKSPDRKPKPRTQKSPRRRDGESTSSSSEEEDTVEEVEEVSTTKTYNYLESTPVDEPVATERFISHLCREDEVKNTRNIKKDIEELLEEEIISNEVTKSNKTVKKDQPLKPGGKKPLNDSFIENEKLHIESTTNKKKIPTKPSESVRKPLGRTEVTTTTTKTTKKENVIIPKRPKQSPSGPGTTEYVTPRSTEPRKPQHKTTEKITVWNVENLSDAEEDTSVHVRTHRIDDTINRRTTKITNGDIPRKPQSVSKKTVPLSSKDEKKPFTRKPQQTPADTKKYTSTHKTTITNTIDNTKPRPKTKFTEPVMSPRKIVSTTITVTPVIKKTHKSVVTTKTVTENSRPSKLTKPKENRPNKTKPSKQPNGQVSSEDETDVESIVEEVDLNERIIRKTTQKTNKVTRTTSDQILKTRQTPKSPVRGFSKPELIPKEPVSKPTKKSETKCITTKSIIINNKDTQDREVVINLLRSKSSREPTPDRLCPLPVSSDDEGNTPRYPDEVTEPDDRSGKPKKLTDIPIMEDDFQFTRITDITDNKKITDIDRVEETDDSLLTVEKKINKFLTTAEKVTKKPVKSKTPAPKKERPQFEVDNDLVSDECLLSVSDKVSKFITTAEQLIIPQPNLNRPKSPICKNYIEDDEFSNVEVSKKVSHFIDTAETSAKPKNYPKGPAPKVDRPELIDVDETIMDDDCLLSVSDKVTKFITTTDSVTTTNLKPKKPSDRKPSLKTQVSPTTPENECVNIESKEHTYSRRSSKSPSPTRSPSRFDEKTSRKSSSEIHEFKTTKRTSVDTTPKSTRKPTYNEPNSVPTNNKMRSSENVKKTKALFENINREQEILKQRNILSRPSVFEGRKPKTPQYEPRTSPERKLKKRLSFSDEEETITVHKQKPVTYKTEVIEKDHSLKSTKLVIDKMFDRQKSPERHTIKTYRHDRDSSPESDLPGYMRPLDRHVKQSRPKSSEKVSETNSVTEDEHYQRESSPESDLPGYMRPLDRSLRPHSPHRANLTNLKNAPSQEPLDDSRVTKFGVTLKRTDSGKAGGTSTVTTTTTDRRRSNIALEKRITEEEVEEIFELEILEELLEKVVGYDLRRKIRAQIRLVKKLISENKLSIYITSRTRSSPKREPSPGKFTPFKPDDIQKRPTEYQTQYIRKTSPERKVVDNKIYQHTQINRHDDRTKKSEYQTSYTYNERRSSSEYTSSTRRSPSPKTKVFPKEKIPEKSRPLRTSPDRRVSQKTSTVTTTTTTRTSPERKLTSKPESKTFTHLKKTTPVSKQNVDDKPEWVRQRNLRKVTDNSTPIKKVTTTTTTTTSTRRGSERTPSPQKEIKPTDIITSSYGVGPTDENGAPLFGLKALRAQNKTEKTKVQGTVIRSQYYSENGGDPVGQISVTKYSSDPKDLGSNEDLRPNNKGVTSVTTTQKFGYKDTPSLRSLTDKKKAITNESDCTTTTTKSTTSKVTRRGSVKAISQKFIDNAVDTLKSERQASYPKAGLILRTSSFKDTSGTDDSREASPVEEDTITTVRTTNTMEGSSFLTNRSKVTGMQDIIGRMKAEDYEVEGDTEEEVKAKALLNKFIGSQVILNAIEGSSKKTTTTTSSPTSTIRSTKITSTITEGGKPRTVTRVFQRPITEDALETVWDEQTLRLLLEQSTDYEERRIIRARLRQVMAEQEACTELVEKASQEQSGGSIEEKIQTTKKTFSTGPVTTTQVTTRVTSQQMSKKPVSPFAKFRQLDKQNSLPSSPSTPKTPSGSGPLFKFTDPALSQSANTIKERLLYWCKQKTKEYENIQLDNFSTSWADGLAFCALVHHFLPDAFDYSALSPKNRRHNFTLAFRVADEKADIAPLLDVDDMVACRKPDWKCVFTYVQSIYRRFKDED